MLKASTGSPADNKSCTRAEEPTRFHIREHGGVVETVGGRSVGSLGWDPEAEGCRAGRALPITLSFGVEPRCQQRDPAGRPAVTWPCQDAEQRGSIPSSSPAERQRSWLFCGYRNCTSPLLAGAPGSPTEDLAAQEFGSCLKSRRNEERLRSDAVMEAQPRRSAPCMAMGANPELWCGISSLPLQWHRRGSPGPPDPIDRPWLGVTCVASFGMGQKTPQRSPPHLHFIPPPAPTCGFFLTLLR